VVAVQGGDLTAEVVDHLLTVAERLREGFEGAAARADLSAGQAKALRHLAAAGPVAMRDLASRMRCDASNVTGIIDRLEERGLVVRRVAAGDRRVKSLFVTPDGQLVAEQLWRQVCEQAAALLEMGDAEWSALVPLLRRAGTRCATGACGREAGDGPPGGADAATAGRPAGRARSERPPAPAAASGPAPTTVTPGERTGVAAATR
jgi:DNA-binding MarR family transcriptional regulator